MNCKECYVVDVHGKHYPAQHWRVNNVFGATIRPEEPIKARWMVARFDFDLSGKQVLAHGFQSWSESFIADSRSIIRRLNPLAKLFHLQYYGDYHFYRYPRKRGMVHSHEYLRVFGDDREAFFAGSLSPHKAYGIFEVDFNTNTITYRTDVEGLTLESGVEFSGISLYIGKSSANYFDHRKMRNTGIGRIDGWTSWYHYYTRITEDILLCNLNALYENNILIDIFQIDDGYQQAVGDWLEVNEKFPHGMASIARQVKDKGIRPGLWLAPFIAEKKSTLFQKHREYCIKSATGKPVAVGYNLNWSGPFYGLDIYHPGLRDYLQDVFDKVVNQCGYEFLKLDFLYAVAALPREGKTRAMVMHDALSFVNEIRGRALMLGCGCPIGVGAGMCEYMRIGADIAPVWEYKILTATHHRERISTKSSLANTKYRAFLHGRAFMNDPDVFILRDTPEVRLTDKQKEELFRTNLENSGIIFFSDDVTQYSPGDMEMVRKAFLQSPEEQRELA